MLRLSLPRLILTGLILSALPAASLTRQSLAKTSSTVITLPATITQIGGGYVLMTELNTLNLNALAGTDTMKRGDVVYLHLNVEQAKNESPLFVLDYPYAISQNRPVRLSEDTISLRGIVTDRNENTIAVDYLFETISAQKGLAKLFASKTLPLKSEILLRVNKRAVGQVKSIKIDGEIFETH